MADAALIAASRGIYPADEADPEFKTVRTFETSEECVAWYKPRVRCTNPAYPECTQIYTTLCDWGQVEAFLLHPLAAYRARSSRPPRTLPPGNVFAAEAAMRASLRARLDLPIHARTNADSTLNTLRYLFFHMRCGIFVLIRDGALRMFVPFVNTGYTNSWGDLIEVENDDLVAYVRDKHDAGTQEEYIADKHQWWANGNIICNVKSPGHWGDSYLPQLRDMLQTLCATRAVPDVEFFINKRDFPQLKRNVSEPYDFIYDQDNVPLDRERYTSYAPIASFFVGNDFADVPFVTTDDWETATGRVYPPNAIDIRSEKNRKTHAVPWADRLPTAIFRGNSTGPGTDATTNQRIKLAALSQAWGKDDGKNARNSVDGAPFLDAGIVGWNLRDRKMQGRPMTFIRPDALGIPRVERVPMYAQARFKYHIYVDGHCAAMRYASMMPLGAVILKVGSITKADSMWFFPLLVPFDIHAPHPDLERGDHIPVAPDLSDLADVIHWAKTHDAECKRIAENSLALYSRVVAKEGQLDFLQLLMFEIAARFEDHSLTSTSARVEDHSHSLAQSALVEPGSSAAADVSVSRAEGTPASATTTAAELQLASAATATSATEQLQLATTTPRLLRPDFCNPPFGEPDWFGAGNDEYSRTCIGVNTAPPPAMPDLATLNCECPACVGLINAAEARRLQLVALQQQQQQQVIAASSGAARSAAAANASGDANIAAASSRSQQVAAPPPQQQQPRTALQVTDQMRAAVAARAALAKKKQSERESSSAASSSSSSAASLQQRKRQRDE